MLCEYTLARNVTSLDSTKTCNKAVTQDKQDRFTTCFKTCGTGSLFGRVGRVLSFGGKKTRIFDMNVLAGKNRTFC